LSMDDWEIKKKAAQQIVTATKMIRPHDKRNPPKLKSGPQEKILMEKKNNLLVRKGGPASY